jgi:hypothetical protein
MHLDPREPAITAPEPTPAAPAPEPSTAPAASTQPAPKLDRKGKLFLGFCGLGILLMVVIIVAAGGNATASPSALPPDSQAQTSAPSGSTTPDPQTQAAALAAFRAGAPDMTSCMDDLSKVDADRTLMATQAKERALGYNSLNTDAQQMVVDCAPLAPAFAAMDVGDNTLAQDARNHWHSAILEVMSFAQDYANGYGDLQTGQVDAGIRLFTAGNAAMSDATADMHAGNQDLGLDGTSD